VLFYNQKGQYMKVGFVGLGKMGKQIVEKFVGDVHEVFVFDVNQDAVEECAKIGAVPTKSREDLVNQLGESPIIWLMIPSEFVQEEVGAYSRLLPSGAILIDGGNSKYDETIERANLCAERGIRFIDVGTSGGVMGLSRGFSLMVGGDIETFDHLEPFFRTLSQPNADYAYMGPHGSGHYVKMIHNGIEYAIMQAYAEGYDLLKYGPMKDLDLAEIARVWQGGSIIQSNLNALVHEILAENPNLDGIDGYVADSGEGRWAYQTAESANVPMPALREALQVRTNSQNGYSTFATRLLSAMRNKFGGHALNK
jgi:6-phosphogluconate dehydrogenase